MVTVIVVMIAGAIATIKIGQSQSNKEEDPGYFQQTGKKWVRLSGIYVIGIVVVIIILIMLNN